MVSMIVYLVACGILTAILSSVVALFRSPRKTEELHGWKIVVGCAIFVFAAPYAYIEVLTRIDGPAMAKAIKQAYESTSFNGGMKYYKVLYVNGSNAKALVVGTDTAGWGGTDNPVMNVTLKKDDDGTWEARSYKILASGRLNQDNLILPPYF